MSIWHQVYENAESLKAARARINRVSLLLAIVGGIVVAGAPFVVLHLADGVLYVLLGAAFWSIAALFAGAHWQRVRAQIWRLEVSPQRLVAYDGSNKPTVLCWRGIHQIDVRDTGICMYGYGPGPYRIVRLFIPASFPNFVDLAHVINSRVSAHGVSLSVDGRAIDDIALSALGVQLPEGVVTPSMSGARA